MACSYGRRAACPPTCRHVWAEALQHCSDEWLCTEGSMGRARVTGKGGAPAVVDRHPCHKPCVQAPIAGVANVVPFNAPEDAALRAAYYESTTLDPQAAHERVWHIMR